MSSKKNQYRKCKLNNRVFEYIMMCGLSHTWSTTKTRVHQDLRSVVNDWKVISILRAIFSWKFRDVFYNILSRYNTHNIAI